MSKLLVFGIRFDTLDVYGHVSKRMKQDSADRMQDYFNSITSA